jgi:hypothetical protein
MTDERLRERLHEQADRVPDRPLDYDLIWSQARSERRRRSGLIALGAVGVVAAIMVGATLAVDSGRRVEGGATSQPSPPVQDVLDVVRGLTGQDVGRALGLHSLQTGAQPCQEFAEYVNGSGFCVEGVSDDPAVLEQIMRQIQDGDDVPATSCEPVGPRRLPDGSPAGEARVLDADVPIYAWGSGDDEVRQQAGADPIGLIGLDAAYHLDGPQWTGYAIYVGDPGVGEIVFAFKVDGCAYTVWLPAGTTKAQAAQFVTTY